MVVHEGYGNVGVSSQTRWGGQQRYHHDERDQNDEDSDQHEDEDENESTSNNENDENAAQQDAVDEFSRDRPGTALGCIQAFDGQLCAAKAGKLMHICVGTFAVCFPYHTVLEQKLFGLLLSFLQNNRL